MADTSQEQEPCRGDREGLGVPSAGRRKIALLLAYDEVFVTDATCYRILPRAGVGAPVGLRPRTPPTRQRQARNLRDVADQPKPRVQMDFFELKTSDGGTRRSGDVIDYAATLVLAGPVATAGQTGRDADRVAPTGHRKSRTAPQKPLIDDLSDAETAELGMDLQPPGTQVESATPTSPSAGSAGAAWGLHTPGKPNADHRSDLDHDSAYLWYDRTRWRAGGARARMRSESHRRPPDELTDT